MDSRLSQPIISQPAKPNNKQQHITGSWKNSYPPADQAFVQQFCSLLNLNNSTDHYKNVRQNLPNFLLFSIINNKETRDIFQSKKFIQQNITRDRMVNFVIKQMQNRQIWNEDVNMTNKMICDIYIYMKKRSNRSTRQKLQVRKNEHQFNLEHPELRKLGTIKKAKDIFNFVAQLKHKREDILKQQRVNGKKNDQIPKTNIITENKRRSLRKIKKATTVDAVNSRKNLISKETKSSPQKVQITLRSGKQIKSNNIIDF